MKRNLAIVYHANLATVDKDSLAPLLTGFHEADHCKLVTQLWQDGKYREAFDVEVDDPAETRDAEYWLREAFYTTQDNVGTRSTSVGDVMLFRGQHYVVAAFGFTPITL